MSDPPNRASSGSQGLSMSRNNSLQQRISSAGGPKANDAQGVPKQRTSLSQWGGPRASATGSVRRSHRGSARGSRRSQMGEGQGGVALQVIDDEGMDRTPKPLMSLKPSVLKGMPGMPEDGIGTPGSEQSEFFLDRLSSASFSRTGWYSENNSGTMTPKSETDEEDYAAKEKARAQADVAGAAAAVEAGAAGAPRTAGEGDNQGSGEQETEMRRRRTEPEVVPPELLTERDLEKQVYISLMETETDFLLVMPCVTVAQDGEEAKAVEEANTRYANLLASKQATDKYSDVETQTLNLVKKTREIQGEILVTAAVACQAATWEISDTYAALEAGSGDGEDAGGVHGNVPSMGQLTGGVARGDAYSTAVPSGNASSRRGTSTSNASFATNGPGMMRQSSMSMAGRDSMMPGQSWAGSNPSNQQGDVANQVAAEGAIVEAAPDPLSKLDGLMEALMLMDAAIAQNLHFQKLLLYRDVRQVEARAASPAPAPPPEIIPSSLSRQQSMKGPSRSMSRVPSRNASESGAGTMEDVLAKLQAAAQAQSNGSVPAPASVAESHWPEELLQDLADLGPDGMPRMEQLWEWKCPLTEGKQVACMAWNKTRPDLLAVGYGSYSFKEGADHSVASQGLVAFWSLKNPLFPLWWFETPAGVTALDFATQSPNILAVGLYDGTVATYDVKSKQGVPAMESDMSSGRHSDPVWKVRWLDRGPEREEPLITISTDGRVTQWSIAKGLEYSDLMKLKRVPRRNTQGGGGKTAGGAATTSEQDAFISRLTSGMSFDFSGKDERIYIAGTEDGWIHKCSTSYSEQYLESYQGHMGPVYQVGWSPYKKDMFISASGDWTLKLWQEGRDSSLLTFQSGNHEVNDVQWCPTNSTVFGSVTSGGRLEIWDFDLSTVKPVVNHKAGIKLTCLLFSPNSPVVVCGSETGTVSVFRVFNIDREYDNAEDQLSRLEEVIRANVMKTQPGQLG